MHQVILPGLLFINVPVIVIAPALQQPVPQRTLAGHRSGAVYAIAFSPDGKLLASGSEDKTIKLWEVATGVELATLEGAGAAVNALRFTPDGKTLVSSGQGVFLWEVETRKIRGKFSSIKLGIWAIALDPDGKALVIAHEDKIIKVLDITSGKSITTLAGHLRRVRTVAFSPDRATISSGGFDSTVKLWDFKTGKNTQTLEIEGYRNVINAVAFSPDGNLLASASQNVGSKSPTLETALTSVQPPFGGNIKFWEVATGKCIATMQAKSIECIAFSPDGKTLASGSKSKTIQLWDVANAREITAIKGHTGWVTCVAFSPDGKTLATGSGNPDKTIKLWDMQPAKAK